ncbi:hypothetical protein BSIN_3944 [Burkholderia singularis]|uniref:Uncharacterized protein n=1 Tax=Burkholderia singularis TaxID=1503053 RepID=A0A238H6B6_9BURK|nr:hypothetical protein BSIN_3944 [Burkholderia singularis]
MTHLFVSPVDRRRRFSGQRRPRAQRSRPRAHRANGACGMRRTC